jgi:predicted  nucleic acid-binding Zn-ribbon protein
MNTLENIEGLIERLANGIDSLLGEREKMLAEIANLRAALQARDEEAVKAAQDRLCELETAQEAALNFGQEKSRIESRLQELNDRLTALVRGGEREGG